MADAGSRAWNENGTDHMHRVWTNVSASWQQISIPVPFHKIYEPASSIFSIAPSPPAPVECTTRRCFNGFDFDPSVSSRSGYHNMTERSNPYSWLSLPFTAGSTADTTGICEQPPCEPKSATSLGIIGCTTGTVHDSTKAMHLSSTACTAPVQAPAAASQSPSRCSSGSETTSTSSGPDTPSSLGLRAWASSSDYGALSFLRRSEFLAPHGKCHQYTITVQDVILMKNQHQVSKTVSEATYVKVMFRGSKTDQFGERTTRTLYKSNTKHICPVHAASMLLEHARTMGFSPTQPLCSFSESEVVPASLLSTVLQTAARLDGHSGSRISCHSLRVGGATALFESGVDTTGIKLLG